MQQKNFSHPAPLENEPDSPPSFKNCLFSQSLNCLMFNYLQCPWMEWQPIPVFLPGESHGQRSLAGYSPWGPKELDMTEQLTHSIRFFFFFPYSTPHILFCCNLDLTLSESVTTDTLCYLQHACNLLNFLLMN